MPFYTYKCDHCGHVFEARQRMSDDPLTDCPVCARDIRRVVNAVGIVFKGSGFYVTDNRNGKTASTASPEKKSETPEAKSSDTSSGDKKAEKKSQSKAEKAAG